jgi:hypothetical protein
VIATGFGPQSATRPSASAAQTPIDMTPYTELTRMRADAGVPAMPAAAPAPRLSITRRPLFDLPLTATIAAPAPPSSAVELNDVVAVSDLRKPPTDADFDLPSTFDVPAFLRRQEG